VISVTYRRFTYRPGAFFGIFAQVMQPSWVSERSMNVSAPEALSREHAMLTRLLLAIDNVVNNALEDRNTDLSPINSAARVIDNVVASHHMVFEEQSVYPRMEQIDYLSSLTETLEGQHDDARVVNDLVLELTKSGKIKGQSELDELTLLTKSFKDMITAHAAWEETIIFPAMYDLLPERDMNDFNRKFMEAEKKLLDGKGPEELYRELDTIEEAAGTHDLAMYTF
jgi:hemerythrin-like domain-containing protein